MESLDIKITTMSQSKKYVDRFDIIDRFFGFNKIMLPERYTKGLAVLMGFASNYWYIMNALDADSKRCRPSLKLKLLVDKPQNDSNSTLVLPTHVYLNERSARLIKTINDIKKDYPILLTVYGTINSKWLYTPVLSSKKSNRLTTLFNVLSKEIINDRWLELVLIQLRKLAVDEYTDDLVSTVCNLLPKINKLVFNEAIKPEYISVNQIASLYSHLVNNPSSLGTLRSLNKVLGAYEKFGGMCEITNYIPVHNIGYLSDQVKHDLSIHDIAPNSDDVRDMNLPSIHVLLPIFTAIYIENDMTEPFCIMYLDFIKSISFENEMVVAGIKELDMVKDLGLF
jgi:hypothetical protein